MRSLWRLPWLIYLRAVFSHPSAYLYGKHATGCVRLVLPTLQSESNAVGLRSEDSGVRVTSWSDSLRRKVFKRVCVLRDKKKSS